MNEAFPLRVEELVRGTFAEWRTSDTLPETECEDWQLEIGRASCRERV